MSTALVTTLVDALRVPEGLFEIQHALEIKRAAHQPDQLMGPRARGFGTINAPRRFAASKNCASILRNGSGPASMKACTSSGKARALGDDDAIDAEGFRRQEEALDLATDPGQRLAHVLHFGHRGIRLSA